MEYNFKSDLLTVREVLSITQEDFAAKVGVTQVTIARNEKGETLPSKNLLEATYNFIFSEGIKINNIKELFWKDAMDSETILLFHGAKEKIDGQLSVSKGKKNNDFGVGFYAGETYTQAVSFVSKFKDSSIYFLGFKKGVLKCKEYVVNQNWMLTIAYYRGNLIEYQEHPIIKKLVKESRECDYIIAPIADNRMFQIIDSFIQGEITDKQCENSLAATNLGKQYVFLNQDAMNNVTMLERTYLCENEKKHYSKVKESDNKMGTDKAKMARIKYRGQGKYIDEILK